MKLPTHLYIYNKLRCHARLFTFFAVLMGVFCPFSLSAAVQRPAVGPRSVVPVVKPRAQQHRTPYDVTLLSENFDLFTAGSEDRPDERDLCEEQREWQIDPALLQTPGWNGGGIYQAGGCACIYAYLDDFSQQYYLGYLESPRFDTTASRGEFVVCFRARSVIEQDWLGVCGVPTNHSEAKQKFAVIGREWGYYEVTLSCGDENTCVQFEPTSDACFIDDVRIIQVLDDDEGGDDYALATPATLPVLDNSEQGYTARWQAVEGAEDYALYDYLYYTTRHDGEAFDYVNTDFSAITHGSVDAPLTPGGESDFYRYLDDIVDRADWMAYMPMYAGGCLGLDNGYASMMPAGISSPALRLAAPGSDLHVSVDVMSPALTTMTLYVYGERGPLGDVEIPLTPEWTTQTVTLPECEDGVSFELVVEDLDAGYAFIDNLRVWQELPAGTTGHVATGYYETAETSYYVPTAAAPAGYRHAFSVSAYRYERDEEGDVTDYTMSAWSDPCFADGLPADGIVRLRTTAPVAERAYSITGRSAHGADRIVIKDGRKHIR